MNRIFQIVAANYASYYDARTLRATRYLWRITFFALAAATFAYFDFFPDDELLGYIITAVTVLAGFSFSILIYLVGLPRETAPQVSLEAENRSATREKISSELVDNVSFFNLIAVFELVVSISLATIPPSEKSLAQLISSKLHLAAPTHEWLSLVDIAMSYYSSALVFVFIFLLLEGLYTFQRLTRRVNYLFTLR
jgi:hypothetical protein